MLPDFDDKLHQLVSQAYAEDVGDGDHSSLSCIDARAKGTGVLKIKDHGILAGVAVAERIFKLTDPQAVFEPLKTDGEHMQPGEVAFYIHTTVHHLLQAERLVLNCMQRMSGIASLTHQYSQKIAGYRTKILDTRKTTPNFRLLEKEAVRIGGALNHRMGLYDMIMLKDNHIDFAGGLAQAVQKAYDYVQLHKPGLKIEVETRSLDDVKTLLEVGQGKVFRVMLDNFSPDTIREALALIQGAFETEASGGITLDNITAYAETGVDFVSIGALIHQARSVDLSLKAVIDS